MRSPSLPKLYLCGSTNTEPNVGQFISLLTGGVTELRLSRLSIAVAVITALVSCQKADHGAAVVETKQPPMLAGGTLYVSEQGQGAIALATTKAVRRQLRDSISTTGWLTVRPSSEVVVKAPVTGFVIVPETEEIYLGQSLAKG